MKIIGALMVAGLITLVLPFGPVDAQSPEETPTPPPAMAADPTPSPTAAPAPTLPVDQTPPPTETISTQPSPTPPLSDISTPAPVETADNQSSWSVSGNVPPSFIFGVARADGLPVSEGTVIVAVAGGREIGSAQVRANGEFGPLEMEKPPWGSQIVTFMLGGRMADYTYEWQPGGREIVTLNADLVMQVSETTFAGPEGPPGPPGPAGAIGPPGPAGNDGVNGKDGRPGRDGRHGQHGLDGAPGPSGAQGMPGAPGIPGDEGPQGPPGAVGPQGDAGSFGYISLGVGAIAIVLAALALVVAWRKSSP